MKDLKCGAQTTFSLPKRSIPGSMMEEREKLAKPKFA
jgi:hypothetical protein